MNAKDCYEGHFCSGGTKVQKPIKTTHSGSICSSGKHCPTGTATELNCTGGYYDRRKGSPACMTCPMGYYCPVGATIPIVCPSTMYCTAGVAAGTFCPAGTYNTEDGLENSNQCRPCPVGKYCTSGTIQGNCNSGYWCDSGAASITDPLKRCLINHYCTAGTSAPVRCAAGKVNPTNTGTSPTDCVDCAAGYYCPETGNGVAVSCPKGFYCEAGVTQPTACAVGTYRSSLNAVAEADCITCPAGALCNVEGVGDLSEFQCPVGKYCESGVRNPTDCPAGTYRNTVGAGATTDCVDCPGGFYCPKGTINPIICPGKTYCPVNSSSTTTCTAGYYCPPQTTTPEDCPQAYYCPIGVDEYIKCDNGTYCPTNSSAPTLCPDGTFGNGNPNNYNADVSCVPCSAGTYSTTSEPGFCFPCTAGYVCLGETKSATPLVAATDNGYECPRGHYCPLGSTSETACPVGTYTDVKRSEALTDCRPCAVDTYNNKTGQIGCKQCAGTATAVQGSTECTCIGVGRQYVNGECLCGQGYSPANGGANENSVYNCELNTVIECDINGGMVPDITGNTCITQVEFCSLQCFGQGDGTGTYLEQTGTCECTSVGDYDAACAAVSCTTANYVAYDCDGLVTVYSSSDVVVTAGYDPSTISGVYGTFTCQREDCKCLSSGLTLSNTTFTADLTQGQVATRLMRILGMEVPEYEFRRDLATVTTISNPVTCITAGNMLEFAVDSTTKSYPVYMKDSLLNTNDAFDYSGFLNLASTIEASTATVSTYVHQFDVAGTYVFMNSLDNYQQTFVKIVESSASCGSTTVSAAILSALYSLNLSTVTETKNVNMLFFVRLIAAKIGLLILLVGFITYMHSMDKKWTFFPWLKKKQEEEEEEERRKEVAKKERAIRLKSQELKEIRDELAKHVEKLRKRIEELEKERLKKQKEFDKQNRSVQINKLLEILRILKKRAKLIRNENGFDFEKDKQDLLIKKRFSKGMQEDANLQKLQKKKAEADDDNKYNISNDLRNQMDEDVENREFQRLDRAQEDNRQQVSNYFDEERRKLEERLRRDGKLNEGEIENILNDYDMHTRDMAQMLQDDERRQQENFKRQLEARKKRRDNIFTDIDKLKEERKKAKEIEAKELEQHFKKMKEEENYIIGTVLVEEEKQLRKNMEKDLENKKKNRMKNYVDKMKRTTDKDEFKKVLDEYNDQLKTCEDELNTERKRALIEIERKIAERKKRERQRISEMKPGESSVDIEGIENKIENKMNLLKKEADDEAAELLEAEREKRKISQEMAMLRKQNDEQMKHLRELNDDDYEEFCADLNRKYDIKKLEDQIDRNAKADLEDLEEKKQSVDAASKEQKIKKANQLLQERAKLIEEKEKKKREYRWKQYQEEEKERDRLRDLEREDWLKREKEAIDAVVEKYLLKGDLNGLAEVLDQAYGAGSKIYAERLLDSTNKLQAKKARRLKYNFNNNLDKKIHEIEELNRFMNPQLERLNAQKYNMSEDEYKTQLKDLMMKENEKRAEIEALSANREQDSQSKTMLDFVDQQKDIIDTLNESMKDLREYAFKPHKIKDKHLKSEVKKINDKYEKELEKMKKDEEESKKQQIDEINNRFKRDADELERNRKDFEMLGMFERRLNEGKDNEDRFKKQNKKLMMDQLNKERDRLGNELTEDEKALLLAKYERKMANLNRALEKEHSRQMQDHTNQLKQKQKEIEMRKRERELLLNSLSMYKDARAQQIAFEDNFERLCSIIGEDLELIDHEAYSGPKMRIYDLIKFKRENDEYLDILGGDVDLLERVRRIERYVANLENSCKTRLNKVNERQNQM